MPFAVPLGVLVAVFDLIPLVWATLGTIVVAAVALTHSLPAMAIVVRGDVHLPAGREPHASAPGLPPDRPALAAAIAASVAAGAELGGVIGALLGFPAAGPIKVVTRELVDLGEELRE